MVKQVEKEIDERLREPGEITSIQYGLEDHGILTAWVSLTFKGSGQGFGGLCLSEDIGPDFAQSLADVFGVSIHGSPKQIMKRLIGKKCYALRCFTKHNSRIEGLESVDTGKRFILTEWRRKHYPKTKDPLDEELESMESTISSLTYRLQEMKKEKLTIASEYHKWTSR